MYCRNCGKEVHEKAVACPACGVPPRVEKNFCHTCGNETRPNQVVCTKCGVSLAGGSGGSGGDSNTKMIAGILAILIGCLGIHKFYLGYQKEGVIMLLVSVLTCGIGAAVMGVIALIEGIMYLTKSDEEFEQTYVLNQKPWF